MLFACPFLCKISRRMPASLKLVMLLPKLRHLTREEAARHLGVTLAELDEANSFCPHVFFADPDTEFPPRVPSDAGREAARDRLPTKMAERQRNSGAKAQR